MKINDVLRGKGNKVVTISPEATVTELLALLAEHNVGAVVVSPDGTTLAGIVSGSQIKYSKKGNRFCIYRLEDQSAAVKCLVWAEAFSKCGELIKDEELLIVDCRIESAEHHARLLPHPA